MTAPQIPRLFWIDSSDQLIRRFTASHKGQAAGVIMLQAWGPQQDLWYWAGNIPLGFQGTPTLPNCGYETTPLAAALRVEAYWRDSGGMSDEKPGHDNYQGG